MKLLATPKYLSQAISPLMTVNYLFGLRIAKYPCEKLRIVFNLIFLLLVSGILCASPYIIKRYSIKQAQFLQLEHILYQMLHYLRTFIGVYETVFGCFYTKQLNACYKKIIQIDDTLRELGSVFNYRKIYLFTISVTVVCFLYIVILPIIFIPHMETFKHTSILIWLFMMKLYVKAISYIVIFEFLIFVNCLQTRFKLINELLSKGVVIKPKEEMKLSLFVAENYSKVINATEQHQNIFPIKMFSQMNRQLQSRIQTSVWRKRNIIKSRTQSRFPFQLQKQFQIKGQLRLQGQFENHSGNTNSIRKTMVIASCNRESKYLLQTIRQMHLELCRVSKTFCTSFGIQITSEIGISLLIITASLYVLYSHLVQKHKKINIMSMGEILLMTLAGITCTLKVILINNICKKTINESKKTNEIIHTIYGSYTDVNIQEEIQQFGLQILQSPMDLITFGISLNYNVLNSCLKTVTTYVVIMIQMSDSLELNKNTQGSRSD